MQPVPTTSVDVRGLVSRCARKGRLLDERAVVDVLQLIYLRKVLDLSMTQNTLIDVIKYVLQK